MAPPLLLRRIRAVRLNLWNICKHTNHTRDYHNGITVGLHSGCRWLFHSERCNCCRLTETEGGDVNTFNLRCFEVQSYYRGNLYGQHPVMAASSNCSHLKSNVTPLHITYSTAYSWPCPLTIYFRVAVCHGWDSDEHPTAIPLDHQLQLTTRLLD